MPIFSQCLYLVLFHLDLLVQRVYKAAVRVPTFSVISPVLVSSCIDIQGLGPRGEINTWNQQKCFRDEWRCQRTVSTYYGICHFTALLL